MNAAQGPLRIILFTVAVATTASLLFMVQPLTARGLLPLLGGSPAVWTTAMLFFQGALLAGYLWAHWIGTRRGPWALGLHASVLAACAVALLARGWRHPPPTDAILEGHNSQLWLLAELALAVGPGFFALASAGPLLQRWFARAEGPQGRDPYALYAASNAGSIAGLLGYPLLVEPLLALPTQRQVWTLGYALAALLIVACGLAAMRRPPHLTTGTTPTPAPAPITPRVRLLWIALAFVPSSFMLGATSYISTDIAAFPLLWVIPLTIYLATFIIAFAAPGRLPLARLSRYASFALLFVTAAILLDAKHPLPVVITLHLVALAGAGIVCHARLASTRPAPERLTEFFVWLSVGGALGGVFNALVAPIVFNSLAEYPIILVLAALAGVRSDDRSRLTRRWWPLPLACALALLASRALPANPADNLARLLPALGIPLAIAAAASARPVAFATCLALLTLLAQPRDADRHRTDLAIRTFFGVHVVQTTTDGPAHRRLIHGTTVHGIALLDRPTLPTAYYHPGGPLGDLFDGLAETRPSLEVAAIGLGVGAVASYARPTDRFTFLEIDRAVARIASDPGLFRFLADARGEMDIRIADGRLGLASMQDRAFDLIILDAFSSDAIPVHLLTADAFALYLARLAPGGVIAVHLSNQHLDLPPVVGAIARELGVSARVQSADDASVVHATGDLIEPSVWAGVARSPEDLARVLGPAWTPAPDDGRRAWTDDYSNMLSVIRWDAPER